MIPAENGLVFDTGSQSAQTYLISLELLALSSLIEYLIGNDLQLDKYNHDTITPSVTCELEKI